MIDTDYEILVASVPDRDNPVVEVWLGKNLLAELRSEGHKVLIEIYPQPSENAWTLDLEQFLQAIAAAKTKLLG